MGLSVVKEFFSLGLDHLCVIFVDYFFNRIKDKLDEVVQVRCVLFEDGSRRNEIAIGEEMAFGTRKKEQQFDENWVRGSWIKVCSRGGLQGKFECRAEVILILGAGSDDAGCWLAMRITRKASILGTWDTSNLASEDLFVGIFFPGSE